MRATRAALVCLMLAPTILIGQTDPDAFWQRQMSGFQRALADPSINLRVYRVWSQLVTSSGQMYTVRPAQQNNLGQALPNGVILLDLSVAGDDAESVTAFWLAHEYAHQVMGHPRLSVSMLGQFIVAQGGTRFEDAADRWAARFLADHSYDIEPVLDFLCGLPGGGTTGAHSPGPARSANVAAVFGRGAESPCATNGARREVPVAGQRAGTPPARLRLGRACYTSAGACPLLSPSPVGETCLCVLPLGTFAGRVGNY